MRRFAVALKTRDHILGIALLVGACSSDAERVATLKAYEDPAPPVSSCDKAAAASVLSMMKSPEMARVKITGSGTVIVHFGNDYSGWSPSQREAMVTTFANADACSTGKARSIEFQSPRGKVIARADGIRGIRMM
jgi:hypothetical protein